MFFFTNPKPLGPCFLLGFDSLLSIMVKHHFAPPFGRICFTFPRHLMQIQVCEKKPRSKKWSIDFRDAVGGS